MTAPFLSLQDLEARGWSRTMIRTLLGAHDQEQMTNKLGQRMNQPARLYRTARVMELEATEAFARAQERARAHAVGMLKAKQTRQAWQTELVARYEALPLPEIQVRPLVMNLRPSTDQTVWHFHLQRFSRWQTQYDATLTGVPTVARRATQSRMLQRYREAVDQAYGWPEERNTQKR
ncbi:hypothetical protein [Deinococcus sp. QL22]|uniref:hypothetical protein n=1 Tax=Deinococcus sp. QL22 TaxID=2939437 RepID=UPI002016FBFB|nr:hypothetical protein [Deinococcus sp. QL22]UQN10115.1 hypothetical protein M1R55_28405 [Deinococcus sp. QL22]